MRGVAASTDEWWALLRAVEVANQSPCQKSKRGVVVWYRGRRVHPIAGLQWADSEQFTGNNAQPPGYNCDGSELCRQHCGKLCIHAEAEAILQMPSGGFGWQLLHVKTVDGEAVPSGPPSCWQCSRLILRAGIGAVWLLHDTGLRRYTATEFHELTLQHLGMPVLRE